MPLVLLGIVWRRGLALALVLAGAAGIAVIAIGPIWNRAALESSLRETLRSTGADAGLRLFATDAARSADVPVSAAAAAFAAAPRDLPGYPARIRGIRVPAVGHTGAYSPSKAVEQALVFRSGSCRAVRVVAGRCPTGAGEGMVSAGVAGLTDYGYRLGAVLHAEAGASIDLRIVGVYAVDPLDPYWFGTAFPVATGALDPERPRFDPVLVDEAALRAVPDGQPASVVNDYLLAPDTVRLADVPRVQRAVDAVRQRYRVGTEFRVESGFGAVIADVRRRQAATDLGGTLVTLQLGLLAWAVLFQIATDAAEARGAEIALLTLRGATRLRTLVFGLTEPLVLLAIAVPLGVAVGLAAVVLLAPAALLPGTPVAVDGTTLLAAALAFTGGLVAIVLAGRRVLRRSVLEQWRRTEQAPRASRSPVVDAVLAAVALLGVAGLLLVGRGAGVLALLAPGLLVAVVGLLGVRVVPVAVRRLLPGTRTARSVPLFLAVRQVARRPAGLRMVAVFSIALGLASFAAVAQQAAATDRLARAQAEVGAPRTFRVLGSRVGAVEAAVARADPAGRWAMVAATWLPGGGTVSGTVLAVQPIRLAAVGVDAAGGSPTATLAHEVAPRVPALTVRGDRLTAAVTATAVSPAGGPQVAFDLITAQGARVQVVAGPLRTGRRAYTAAVPCAAGCELLGLTWQRAITVRGAVSGSVLLTGLTAGRGGTASRVPFPRRPDTWIAAPPVSTARDRVRVDAAGVHDRFSSDDGGWGGIVLASHPLPVPVVAAPGALLRSTAGEPPGIVDAAGNRAAIRVVRTAAVLPVVLDAGAVVGIEDLRFRLGSFEQEAVPQVWLGGAAPPDAVRRLQAQGLQLRPLDSVDAAVGRFSRQGPALSLLLLAACAAAGAGLAMAATAISIASTARRRSYEAAAMVALGLRRRQVGAAAVLEQLLLLVAAVVLGVPAGWAAAVLVLPILPRFATPTPVALTTVPSALPALLVAAVFLVLVVLAAVVGAAGVLRAADGGRLRGGEE